MCLAHAKSIIAVTANLPLVVSLMLIPSLRSIVSAIIPKAE
jgi:hypothetical protein